MTKKLSLLFFISSISIPLLPSKPFDFWKKLQSNDFAPLVYDTETNSLHYARWIGIELIESACVALQKTSETTEQNLQKLSSNDPVILKQEGVNFFSSNPCDNLLHLWITNQITHSEYNKRKSRIATPINFISPYTIINDYHGLKMALRKNTPVNFWHAFPNYQSIDCVTSLDDIRHSCLSSGRLPDCDYGTDENELKKRQVCPYGLPVFYLIKQASKFPELKRVPRFNIKTITTQAIRNSLRK